MSAIKPGRELWNTLVDLQSDSPEKFDKVIQTARQLEELKKANPEAHTTICRLVGTLANAAT